MRSSERFHRFRREYNEQRPHEALGMQTPSAGVHAVAAGVSGAGARAGIRLAPCTCDV